MSTQLPPKRMRLGTHSCAECRKRKTRCVFPESSTVCQGCLLHQVECKAQQPWTTSKRPKTRNTGEPASGCGDTATRLSEMESTMQRICDAIGLPRVKAVQTLTQTLTPESTTTTTTTKTTTSLPAAASCENAESAEGGAEDSEDAEDEETTRNAPLMSLLREALLARGSHFGQPGQSTSSGSNDDKHLLWQLKVRGVTSLLPKPDGLRAIFEGTRPFWDMWLPYYFGPDASDTLQQASISTVLAVISASWSSDDPIAKAKARMWLALCLIQLSNRWIRQHPDALPRPRQSLVHGYLSAAQELLFLASSIHLGSGGGGGDTLEALEVSAYLMRAHVDLGRPRKAWATARQAISSAQLLGLHREPSNASNSSSSNPPLSRRRDLWDSIWQLERMHSMGLGLPTAISDADISVNIPISSLSSSSPIKCLRHHISVVAGAVIRRDQVHVHGTAVPPLDASVIAAWEAARELCPPGFWTAEPPSGLRLGELYVRQSAQVYYFSVGKMLHLPALIAGDVPGSSACLAASRGVVQALLGLRGYRDEASGVESIFCESADFQGFAAGMVLAVSMLRHGHKTGGHVADAADAADAVDAADAADMALLKELRDVLLEAADALDCSVARQGGEVLQLVLRVLSSTADGNDECTTSTDDREYDVVVPYFGRLKIRFPRPPGPDVQDGQPLHWEESCASFDLNFFECGIDAYFDLDAELAAPWDNSWT